MKKITSLVSGLALFVLSAQAAPVQAAETMRLTIAAGHPVVFLWVKHLKETFIPVLDAELAKTGELKIDWSQGYGGTIVKLGSEVDAFQSGIMDVGQTMGVFNPAKFGLLNVTYAMPFGPADARQVTKSVEEALISTGALANVEKATGVVYIGGGISIDDYNIGAAKKIDKVADLQGIKLGGAGPNLAWLRSTNAVGVQGSFVSFYNDIKTGIYSGYIGWMTAGVPAKLYEVAPFWNEVHFGAMYIGGLGVAKAKWDKFSESTKAAFRKAAAAYSEAYLAEQTARYQASVEAHKKAGGSIVEFPAAERSKWIAAMPNPTTEWAAAADARGEPAMKVLDAYQKSLASSGFKFERDYLAK
jgi:TRAP-type C4-dicarboxylate transport system substrate-binding protein